MEIPTPTQTPTPTTTTSATIATTPTTQSLWMGDHPETLILSLLHQLLPMPKDLIDIVCNYFKVWTEVYNLTYGMSKTKINCKDAKGMMEEDLKHESYQEPLTAIGQKAFSLFQKTKDERRCFSLHRFYSESKDSEQTKHFFAQCLPLLTPPHGKEDRWCAHLRGRTLHSEKRYQEAMQWFEFAAKEGNANAQRNIGLDYDQGRGVSKDLKEASRWFRLSADQNHPDALVNIGYAYENGFGVERDYKEAVRNYRLAVDQDNMYAQFNLGKCYQSGTGVEQNLTQAKKFLQLSALQGYSLAKRRLATFI